MDSDLAVTVTAECHVDAGQRRRDWCKLCRRETTHLLYWWGVYRDRPVRMDWVCQDCDLRGRGSL